MENADELNSETESTRVETSDWRKRKACCCSMFNTCCGRRQCLSKVSVLEDVAFCADIFLTPCICGSVVAGNLSRASFLVACAVQCFMTFVSLFFVLLGLGMTALAAYTYGVLNFGGENVLQGSVTQKRLTCDEILLCFLWPFCFRPL